MPSVTDLDIQHLTKSLCKSTATVLKTVAVFSAKSVFYGRIYFERAQKMREFGEKVC